MELQLPQRDVLKVRDGKLKQAEGAGMELHLPHRDVLKVRNLQGLKTCALACTYNHKGNWEIRFLQVAKMVVFKYGTTNANLITVLLYILTMLIHRKMKSSV